MKVDRKLFENVSLMSGMSLLFFVFSIYFLSLAGFMFNLPLSASYLYFALFMAIIFVIWLWSIENNCSLECLYISVIFLFVSLLASWIVSKVFFDLSFDGQSYHREAINQLVAGWNPIKEKIVPDVWDHTFAIWLNHFPLFSWIEEAVFCLLDKSIESGKIVNTILGISCFLISFGSLAGINKFKTWVVLLISFIIAFNPIFSTQFWSYYLDTQLASVLFIFVLLSLSYWLKPSRSVGILLVVSIIILLNIKMTSIAYLPVLAGGFWILGSFFKKSIQWRYLVLVIFSFIAGLVVFGFQPYSRNYVDYSNPLYPMYTVYPIKQGDDKNKFVKLVPALPYVENIREFIYESNMPYNFAKLNRFEKLFLSIFSKSSNLFPYVKDGNEYANNQSELKFPGFFTKSELLPFQTTDVRIGGFGPYFGLILLLSFLIPFLGFYYNRRLSIYIVAFGLVVFISSLLNSELWWARYVPQLWLIPVSVYLLSEYYPSKVLSIRLLKYSLLIILFINTSLILLYSIKYQLINSKYRNNYLTSLIDEYSQTKTPILLDFDSLRGVRSLYKERGIKYLEKSIEIGVVENHLLLNLNISDKETVLRNYKKDLKLYKYVLQDYINDSDKIRLANIINKNDLRLNKLSY